MSNHKAVSIDERQQRLDEATNAAITTAERWLEFRAKGLVPRHVDLALDLAISDVRRAERRLHETTKRLARTDAPQGVGVHT